MPDLPVVMQRFEDPNPSCLAMKETLEKEYLYRFGIANDYFMRLVNVADGLCADAYDVPDNPPYPLDPTCKTTLQFLCERGKLLKKLYSQGLFDLEVAMTLLFGQIDCTSENWPEIGYQIRGLLRLYKTEVDQLMRDWEQMNNDYNNLKTGNVCKNFYLAKANTEAQGHGD